MPDVWTTNPEKLRTVLEELGAICGEEARVIKPRDQDWTCHIDSKGWLRDVYIHDIRDYPTLGTDIIPLAFCLLLGLLLGRLWVRHFG